MPDMESLAYQSHYVSCMKINGVPLLPPLMTQECRQEMQYYKKLAIAVEKRISELKTCIDDSTICSNNIVSDTEDGFDDINLSFDIVPESDKITIPNDNSESTKCDEIDCQDDYENLNSETTIIDFNSENLHKPDIQTKDMNDLHVNDNKIHPSNGSHRNETTSDNLIDSKISTKPFSIEPPVTEDNILTKKKIDSENVKDLASTKNTMIQKAIKSVSPLKKEFQSPIIINRTYTKEKTVSVTKTKKTPPKNYKMPASKNITGSLNDISSGLSSPPKLVRQNSYTLDSPSPLLLAHLESQSQSSGIQLDSISMSDLPNIQQSSTLEKSVEHKVKQSTSSKKSNELKISLDQNGCKENTQLPITATPTIKYDNTKTESHSEQQSVKPSVKRNLFADESLLNNNISADKSSNGTTENKITELKTISKDLNESDIYLNMIMKKIRDDQEKQMMKLIKMQQEEQELLRQSFAKQQNILLTQFKTAITNAKNIGSKNSLFANSDNNNREKSLVKSNHNTENSSISPQSIENTDKYLSISLDILNESRTLLTNKREVKLSPTDIQCVNVIPSKLTESKEIKNTKNSIPVQSSEPSLYDESDISLKSGKSLNGSNIGSAYYLSDSNMNSNSSILQDDLNLSFCSDEGSHTNKSFENSKNRSSNILNDTEKAIKLKKALNKISEIQKNLASQTLAMEKRSFRNDNDISQESLHNISLSSIEYMPTYEPDQKLLDRHSLSLDLVDIHRPSSKQTRNRVGKSSKQICIERNAATLIVAYCKGYLVRRLMKTERVQMVVQTIKDTLLCALQLHRDEGGIQGPDIELHRRLIQQITAACYSLNEIFILFSPAEKMNIIAQDRERKMTLSYRSNITTSPAKQLSETTKKVLKRKMEGMSKSHSGAFTNRSRIHYQNHNVMTRSYYGSFYQSDSARSSINEKTRKSLLSNDVNRRPWR